MKRAAWGVILIIALTGPTQADFDAGIAAFERGDYATALQELRPLAEQGHAEAQNYLGWMYRWGLGVPMDDAEAVKWYRKAAEQGIAEYMTRLASMYLLDWGVPQDDVKAHMWYDLAAAAGDKDAREFRDNLAREMTLVDISMAQELAREWLEKHGE